MPRYIRRRSSRSTASDGDRLQEALLRELEREGEKLLKRMASEFTRDLEKQSRSLLQDLFSAKPGSASGTGPLVSTAASLIGVLVSQASARSSTNTTTSESERSRATTQAFRVSRGQSMAEAAQALAKSDRNL